MFQGSVTKSSISANALPEIRELALRARPQDVACALRTKPGLVWLDSSGAGSGRLSLLTVEPEEVLTGNIWKDWDKVERVLEERRNGCRESIPAGGLFGWVGYDGDFVFGVHTRLLVYEQDCDLWTDVGGLSSELPDQIRESVPGWVPALDFSPGLEREAFMEAVRKAQEYISAGDIYQVNLSYPWQAAWPEGGDPMALYLRLRSLSPAPHAAYMDLHGTRVLSSSPECFLRMNSGQITTRPIKGTRPRFPDDLQRDESSAHELASSPKERAELLMITDLERNDLGMVCGFGSVHVPELEAVERYAQVFHLVSTVTGALRPEISHAGAFKACFPGGSITGAPKKRAREIIAELENGPRGLYTGAIGYFGFNGVSEFNIAIRTAVQQGDSIRFDVGAGIVADSIPELEWEETLHKAGGLLRMARQA